MYDDFEDYKDKRGNIDWERYNKDYWREKGPDEFERSARFISSVEGREFNPDDYSRYKPDEWE